MTSSKLTAGAENISEQLVHQLNKKEIPFNQVSWKNGSQHYVLTVRTSFGTRFARFAPINLLEQDDLMTQQINSFIINQLITKLSDLKAKQTNG
jgi:hypothetical protein